MTSIPTPPVPSGGPASDWAHKALYDRVIATLYALPDRFVTPLNIEGVPVTDLFTMNSALGAAIEKGVVESLNDLRGLWDPNKEYADYSFVRQTQCFPDVILRTENPNPRFEPIIMGIELKGWFVLSKEAEPSFRYHISPDCCADADLLVILPWVFNSVISGQPELMAPIISEAKFAAHQRNYHWEWVRGNPQKQEQELRGVQPAEHKGVYPVKGDQSSDKPVRDAGGNFGRIARCGVIDEDVKERLTEPLLGIPASAWLKFIKIFADGASPNVIESGVKSIERAFETSQLSKKQRSETADLLSKIAYKLKQENP